MKQFENGDWYNGKIKSYSQKREYYSIKYDDGETEEFNGIKAHQKNIKAYCMYDFDLFVQIHISKLNYTASDSIQMMEIISTMKK